MIGLKIRNITRDNLMIYAMCFEYNLSFTNMLKLFNISKKYFWTFLEVCHPMIKMGVRKALNMRKSVDNILPYLKTREKVITDLTPREDKILETFSWFLEDSFSDGETCFHVTHFKDMPFVKAYRNNNILMASSYKSIVDNIDDIDYVKLGDIKFFKTSRFLYYMEKYSGDTDVAELNKLSVKEMLKRIELGEEKLAYEEAE